MSNSTVDRTTDPKLYQHCLQGLRAIINPEPFVRWLEKQPTDRLFGSGIDNCALAQWSGYEVGFVTYGYSSYLPPWAVKFVREFCEGDPRTVRRALQIMRAQS